jgi:hypothetical protein
MLPAVAFGLALAGGVGARVASAGAPLGIAIGSIAFAAVVVPPLLAAARDTLNAIAVAVAGAVGATIMSPGVHSLVLLAVLLALAGLVRALLLARVHAALAGAIVTVIAFAWLSWPIWLSHHFAGSVSLLVAPHPIFAINATLSSPDTPDWTHLPLMYRLTSLGQDVPFAMPTSVWPCALAHLAIAAVALTAAQWVELKRSRRGDVAPSGR